MGILEANVRYFPYEMPSVRWTQQNFCVDKIKMNLLWLVMPEVDDLVTQPWAGNDISRSIDTYLYRDLRRSLSGPPIEFMRDFMMLDSDSLELTAPWPSDYLKTMWARAREANARLIGELGVNVVRVDFTTGRRFG